MSLVPGLNIWKAPKSRISFIDMEMLTQPLAVSDTCLWVNTYPFNDVTLKHVAEVSLLHRGLG